MAFNKGDTPWNKGLKGCYTRSEESKQKLSNTLKELYASGNYSPMKGKHHSSESNLKRANTLKKLYSEGKFMGNRGKKATTEKRNKLSLLLKEQYKTGKRLSWNKGRTGLKTSDKGQLAWNKDKQGLQVAWNKGLTSEIDPRLKIMGEKIKATRLKNNSYKITDKHKNKLRLKTLEYIESHLDNGKKIIPFIGKNESYILKQLEQLFRYNIIRQYKISSLGYFVDGYIPELNLCIEVDEPAHNRNIEKDINRQKQIEKELNCQFLRIKDNQQ